LVGSEIRAVRIAVAHLRRIEELVHSVPVAGIQRFVETHPLIDHERLTLGQAIGYFGPLLFGKLEVGFSERWDSIGH